MNNTDFVLDQLKKGKKPSEIKYDLTERGLSYEKADIMVDDITVALKRNGKSFDLLSFGNISRLFLILIILIFVYAAYFVLSESHMNNRSDEPKNVSVFNGFPDTLFLESKPSNVSVDYRLVESNGSSEYYYESRWSKGSTEYYTGISFDNLTDRISIYESFVAFYDSTLINENTANELASRYFYIPSGVEFNCNGICKSMWQDEKNNQNGIVIFPRKTETSKILMYFCSVPETGKLYNKKYCVEDVTE